MRSSWPRRKPRPPTLPLVEGGWQPAWLDAGEFSGQTVQVRVCSSVLFRRQPVVAVDEISLGRLRKARSLQFLPAMAKFRISREFGIFLTHRPDLRIQ